MISPLPDAAGRIVRALAWREPEQAFEHVRDDPHLVWLDSNGPVGPRSRYSYLCVDPFEIVELDPDEDPFTSLANGLARWPDPVGDSGPVPFMGGAVGLLGYGLAHYLERLPRRHVDDPDVPEFWFGLFDLVLAFDRADRRCWLISTGRPEQGGERRAARARTRADWLETRLGTVLPDRCAALPELVWQPDLSAEAYASMVGRGLDYIRAGDIFQANLTMRHVAARPAQLDPASVHLALRRINPAPFGAYLAWAPGRALCSSSPERFIRLEADGWLETRPIKGTRPRPPDPGRYPERDAQEAAMLVSSVKDRAENLMIVDLMRNDIARVAECGSVKVPLLCELETFATVHHLVSSVTARLRPDADAVALLRATFPGGSVTGAPKIRAMEIIDELEAAARGIYCGCIAWIGFDGAMDSSIVIRTLVLTGRQVVAQAGGGIVADSVAAQEYDEMLTKVAPLLSVFSSAGAPT
ncbi:MAG: aminodeoxychorismate synthase component I [Janthinobacterium lividum]